MLDQARVRLDLGDGLLADSLSVYATQMTALTLQLFTGVLLARALAPEGRGVYAIVTLIPFALVALGNLGLGMVNTRLAARETSPPAALWGNSLLVAGCLGLLYALAVRAALEPGTGWLKGVEGRVLTLALFATPLLLFNSYASALVLGRGGLRESNRLRLMEGGLLLAFLLLVVVVAKQGIVGAVVAWLTVVAVTTVALFRVCWRLTSRLPTVDLGLLARSLSQGLRGAAATACVFLLFRSDLFLVGYFMEPKAVGHYAVASALANLLLMLPSSIGMAFLPRASRSGSASGRLLSPLLSRVTFAVTVGVAVLILLVAQPLVKLLYGGEYLPAVIPLLLLLPGIAAASVALVLGADVQGRGLFHFNSISAGLGLVVNVGLNLVLIPRWGLAGAAVSSTIAYGVGAVIIYAAFRRSVVVSWYEVLVPRLGDWNAIASGARRLERVGQ